jgi:catechol 2,3-dioxygenase-like lactoylglutathione lyase family enzyme
MAVTRIARISFTATDAERRGRFYRDAFGFEAIAREHYSGKAFAQLIGLEGAEARALVLRLGDQELELLAFAELGNPYPAGSTSDDLRFQHIAIVVSDMRAAYARLLKCDGWTPITIPAPQRLPVSSGSVTAFKFRDPEGHPLELLAFPSDNIPPYWKKAPPSHTSCLGIDHSAIVVASTVQSIEFYHRILGFSVGARSLNHGQEQERLDAVPNVVVEVTALDPETPAPPHLELLSYRSAAARNAAPPMLSSNDIAASRLVLEVDQVTRLEQELSAASVRFISTGIVKLKDGRSAALIYDPDGHALLLLNRV